MAVAPLYLADKSALARFSNQLVAQRLGPLLTEGLIATCAIIDLEVLYSARSLKDYEEILEERRALPTFPITQVITDRAIHVQHRLAKRGHHRVSLPDLLIAATAEVNNISVMHYDADYDRIAEVTGQRTQWVAPRGSI